MSAPLVPSPLDYVGRRKFVLFPPIANAGPNEWLRGRSSWAEVQLVNAITGEGLWVAWQYICGVSDGPDLDIVVELKEGLEVRDGNVSPKNKRVIPMPVGIEAKPALTLRKRRKRGPAPVIGIKTEDETPVSSHFGSKLILALAALLVLTALVFRVVRL
jgi:hypothetical protein